VPRSSPALRMAAIGGQALAGSGFESERPAVGFQRTVMSIGAIDSGTSAQQSLFESASETMAHDTSVGSVSSSSNPQPSSAGLGRSRWMGVANTVQRVRSGISRAVFQIYALRRRLPCDRAPAVAPPRMPIDHEE